MTNDELNHRASPLIAHYRQLKGKSNDLNEQLDELRVEIAKIITADGNYKDDQGFATINEVDARPTFPNVEVERQALLWAASPDPATKLCGNTLLSFRTETPARKQLRIK